MAGMSGGAGGSLTSMLGGAGGQQGGAGGGQGGPEMAAGSPAATQSDIYQLQRQQAGQQQAQPVFGAGGDDTGRAAAIQQMLAPRQGSGGGPTSVRRSAQPVMGA